MGGSGTSCRSDAGEFDGGEVVDEGNCGHSCEELEINE